jgi:hypothetical protein
MREGAGGGMFQCGEKEWRERDFIGLAAILSGHALDGIGCLPSVNLKRIDGEPTLTTEGV